MRLVFIAFAAHAYTDNVLISTTACVFFTFATAVFARGAGQSGPGVRTEPDIAPASHSRSGWPPKEGSTR